MKSRIIYFLMFFVAASCVISSCSEEFLDRPPLGSISENALANENGVQGSLLVAYRALQGRQIGAWYTGPNNWLWGGVRSDDAYKGSEALDQATEINPVERFEVLPSSPSATNKWRAIYDGIGMANITIRLANVTEDIPADRKTNILAQARFIRGFLHFEAARNYKNVAYVDETVITTEQYRAIVNTQSIYPQIEEDLKFAMDNLPNTQAQIGRVNKWGAMAFLAKAYLYQNKFTEAKALFDQIIANGTTSNGTKYGLEDEFKNVFRGQFENGKEIIFSIQYTVGDGTNGANANVELELTNPHNDGPVGCCGFYQPAQSLVNAYRTSGGLPLLDTYNQVNVRNHESNPSNFPDRGELDPRLDYTVGRIGVTYKDYGPAAATWIRQLANGGPWLPNKHIQWRDEVGPFFVPGSWGQGQLGKNQIVMRYADLLLMAAECEVEVGSLATAQLYVNQVRARAKGSTVVTNAAGQPEANYQIELYSAPWSDKDLARKAVRFERYLELGMEGHRFYDLVRWGTVGPTMSEFLARESQVRTHLAGATFRTGKDEYLPIPEFVVNQGAGNIQQNPGY
jgi:starch-binding outer membrane protein, SusD/RagB family